MSFASEGTRAKAWERRRAKSLGKASQRQGIGKTLLVAAMGKFIEIFNTVGGIGLFVDAKDQDAKHCFNSDSRPI
jgi:hypothetical protein